MEEEVGFQRPMTDQLHYDDVAEGDALPALEKTPTTRQLVMYAGASGDYYEIHYDQDYARSLGLPGVIVHGALKSAFLAQLVTDWMGERGALKRLSVQYRGMDMVGQSMRCAGTVAIQARRERRAPCRVRPLDGEPIRRQDHPRLGAGIAPAGPAVVPRSRRSDGRQIPTRRSRPSGRGDVP